MIFKQNLFLLFLIIFLGLEFNNLSSAQTSKLYVDLQNNLIEMLDKKEPDTAAIRKILSKGFSNKWLLLVDYKGKEQLRVNRIEYNLFKKGSINPYNKSSILRLLPFFDIFDSNLYNIEIVFEIFYENGNDEKYPPYEPKINSSGSLHYITLLEDKKINEVIIRIDSNNNKLSSVEKSNWLVDPQIPIFIGNQKISPLTAFMGGLTATTFYFAKKEKESFNNFSDEYDNANSSAEAILKAIKAEKANARNELFNTISVVSLSIFAILAFNDIFIQSKSQAKQENIDRNIKNINSSNINFNIIPELSNNEFTLGVKIEF